MHKPFPHRNCYLVLTTLGLFCLLFAMRSFLFLPLLGSFPLSLHSWQHLLLFFSFKGFVVPFDFAEPRPSNKTHFLLSTSPMGFMWLHSFINLVHLQTVLCIRLLMSLLIESDKENPLGLNQTQHLLFVMYGLWAAREEHRVQLLTLCLTWG